MKLLPIATTIAAISTSTVQGHITNHKIRRDGVPATLFEPGVLEAKYRSQMLQAVEFKPFPSAFVAEAKRASVDWRLKGAVTPAKDQGPYGYCGTFGRTAAAEGQYALRG